MCKILKAEMVGKDLHIQCECMPESVYGTDKIFTVQKAILEFRTQHASLTRITEKPKVNKQVLGSTIS